MTLREEAPMEEARARMLNPLQLAYIGDAVWELLVRSRLILRSHRYLRNRTFRLKLFRLWSTKP